MDDYAVIEMGGKQYRVEKGGSVLVDRIDAEQGAKVSPRALVYRSAKQSVIDGPELEKVKVEAVVAEHLKGPKVRVFSYRPKKRYRRRLGHRSLLTRLEISDIKLLSRRPAGAKSEHGDGDEPRPAAKKKESEGAAEKKPAARRKPAPKKKES
jgi:large subunit ribosomal protein L21